MSSQGEPVVLSSLPLQVLVHHHFYFDIVFFLLGVALLIYKEIQKDFQKAARNWEIVILVFWLIIELTRLQACGAGNKTEEPGPMLWSLLLFIPVIFAHIYFLKWQIFIEDVELVANWISISMLGLECLFSIICTWRFQLSKNYI